MLHRVSGIDSLFIFVNLIPVSLYLLRKGKSDLDVELG